jgi:hypothetical protein
VKILDPIEPLDQQPVYDYTVDLEDVVYRVRLVFRERSESWYLDLYNAADEPLLTGKRLSVNTALLDPYQIDGLPPGELMLVDMEAPDDQAAIEADFDSLGFRHQLVYYDVADLPPAAVAEELTITIL